MNEEEREREEREDEFWKYGNILTLIAYLWVGFPFSETCGATTHRVIGILVSPWCAIKNSYGGRQLKLHKITANWASSIY